MKKVSIIGVGEYLPKKVLTNADLEKMVDTTDEWITTRSGIKERRLAAEDEATSDLALKATKQALEEAHLNAKDLELIIVATITPDKPFPAVSCLLQDYLGAKKAVCFDVSAACAGFVYGIAVAQQFIARGVYKNALVVGAEILSRITDWEDRSTCVLFGDGAGAAVLAEVSSGGILSVHLGSDGSKADLLMLPGGGSRIPVSHQSIDQRLHFMKMQGNEVFKLAVTIMADAARTAFNQAGLECKDIDLVIPHQANVRIIMAMAKKLGLAPEKIYLNIEKYGNMSSASTATALCEAVREGRIKRGDIVLLVAFGAGLVWGSCVIKW
ncbi:MAG: 3-oxoacyl-ACP synthase [Omnitrophica WOR_2 bacterium SM23_72]|nr:MAG: 3-oxoacyl-ACP synthase [Omnitrophica WOR_2 bacterium SM23_72]